MLKAPKQKSEFEACPEGLWPGVCIDVVDKGMQQTSYGPKHKIQIRFLADAKPPRKDGRPYMVTKKLNLSMAKKSSLRPFLELWRGKPFPSDADAYDFDIESIIGAAAQLQVAHGKGDEGPYAFVQAALRAFPGMKKLDKGDYVRESERPGYKAPESIEEEEFLEPDPVWDEPIPEEEDKSGWVPF